MTEGSDVPFLAELLTAAEAVQAIACDDRDFAEQAQQAKHSSPTAYAAFLAQRAVTAYGVVWNALKAAAHRLLAHYAGLSDLQRHRVWRRVAGTTALPTLLYKIVDEELPLITAPSDLDLVVRLITVFSVIDEGMGIALERIIYLSRLCLAAQRVGIDYRAVLNRIAAISGTAEYEYDIELVSTRQFLAEFEPAERW